MDKEMESNGLIVTPNGAVGEEAVSRVEQKLGVTFPSPYRSWILRTGGGYIGKDLVIPGTNESGLPSQIDGPEDLPLLQELQSNEIVPDQYIVIADGHGGALALRVRGEDIGSVWWVDYDVADEEDIYEPSEDVMRRLADDFDSFLALL